MENKVFDIPFLIYCPTHMLMTMSLHLTWCIAEGTDTKVCKVLLMISWKSSDLMRFTPRTLRFTRDLHQGHRGH